MGWRLVCVIRQTLMCLFGHKYFRRQERKEGRDFRHSFIKSTHTHIHTLSRSHSFFHSTIQPKSNLLTTRSRATTTTTSQDGKTNIKKTFSQVNVITLLVVKCQLAVLRRPTSHSREQCGFEYFPLTLVLFWLQTFFQILLFYVAYQSRLTFVFSLLQGFANVLCTFLFEG